MLYYAHMKENCEFQTVDEHLKNVAELTSLYSKEIDAQQIGYICGILHDIGKYSIEFQNRLLRNGEKVDHSTAGALEAKKLCGEAFGIILGYIICGHHAGLMDYGSQESGLRQRYLKKIPKYEFYISKIDLDISKINNELPKIIIGNGGFTISFFIRMIYSCLVDADFLDTEKFMNVEDFNVRGNYQNISSLANKFEIYMANKSKDAKKNKINNFRNQILNYCVKAAYQKPNLFTLTVPTGGGKTLSSMAFALRHLKHNNLKRIICVIPYTSIIEQNAKQYKDIFGEENVLEHHSNFDFTEVKNDNESDFINTRTKLKYASENWDIPIIVTTNVQFFESLFASKSSRCRKIHNIANSVVIIDEAQMMPTKFLKSTLNALSELVNNYNSSIVLMTATKPEFPNNLLKIEPIEIIEKPEVLYNELKRVDVHYVGRLENDGLVEQINDLERVLVVVNTRNHAKKIYEKADKTNLFHLSANMCPTHRSKLLQKIKLRLKKNEPCKIISTTLIECGVDISLPVVYRALTGIDSIAQAAGRCNREGEIDLGHVYVFESTEDYGKAILFQNRTAECGRQVLETFDDPLSLEAISRYFELLYDIEKDKLDSKNIMNDFEEGAKKLQFSFETAARDYKLIDESESLIIPYNDEAVELIEKLKYIEYPNAILRKLQKFTISIHKNKLDVLENEGAISIINNRFTVLTCKDGFYDENVGLCSKKQEILMV